MKKLATLIGHWHKALLVSLLLMVMAPHAAHARMVTDITGKKVNVPDKVQRVLLGEARLIYTFGILEGKDLFKRVAGWQGDLRYLDVQGYNAIVKAFPQAEKVPVVGGATAETFNVEKALSVQPDVVLLSVSGGHGPGPGSDAVRQIEAAGVPVVFVDFSLHPLKNTVPSIRIMGDVLGSQKKADEFAAFYDTQMQRVTTPVRLSEQNKEFKRPTVFVDMLAGLRDCCGSPGKGNFGEMIDLAGGENIGAQKISGPIGTLNLEYILARNPDIYIATGVFASGQGGVTLGYQATKKQAMQSLKAVANRDQTKDLSAVINGRVYGLWHIFYDSPEHLMAVQALAKWIHPELFRDLDPQKTRDEFYARFMPIPQSGVVFTGLTP